MNNETLNEAVERLQKDKYGVFISKDADVKGQLVIDTAKAAFKSGMIEGGKFYVKQLKDLQELKYYAGETGYMTYTEWKEFIDNIK